MNSPSQKQLDKLQALDDEYSRTFAIYEKTDSEEDRLICSKAGNAFRAYYKELNHPYFLRSQYVSRPTLQN